MKTMTVLEAPFEMANLFPKHTGLPFVVWISVRGGARHDVRVKVSANAKAIPEEMATVGVRPRVHVIEGEIAPDDLKLLSAWIALNSATLISYWDGEIDTAEAIAKLVSL